MAESSRPTVIGGVDTHKDTHTAAALDSLGKVLDTTEFPAAGTASESTLPSYSTAATASSSALLPS